MTFELRKRSDGALLLIDRHGDHIKLWGTFLTPEIITDKQLVELGAIKGTETWGSTAELLWRDHTIFCEGCGERITKVHVYVGGKYYCRSCDENNLKET